MIHLRFNKKKNWPQIAFADSPPSWLDSKESACDTGNLGSIPGLGKSPGGGHGNPLQYSCLENPHGQRSLKRSLYNPTVHGVVKSWT